MRKILSIIATFMLSVFVMQAQANNISQKMNLKDSLTVNVKFENVKLSKEESVIQEQINGLITNSIKTTDMLSTSINRLTNVIEQNITLSRQTKIDIVATQMGVTTEVLNKTFKRNNIIKLIALIPALLFIFWTMKELLLQKGLDIKHVLTGTAVMALYAFLGSGVLYAVLSLVFNKQYFVMKDLLSALF